MNHHSVGSSALSLIGAVCALVSCAVPQHAASQALRAEAGGYQLEVLVNGASARTFEHAGETYVLGQKGSRYVLRIHNRSGRRVEAVVSVDGLDVIDGKAGDFANKRGYLVDAYGFVDIDGWRLSNREVAAFRFSPIGESYAAKTGRARNVGVIGVALFPERAVRQSPAPYGDSSSSAPRDKRSSYDAEDLVAPMDEKLEGLSDGAREPAPSVMPAPMSSGRASPSQRERSEDALADAPAANSSAQRRARSGLGTEFGEAVSSEIHQIEFVRAHASRPSVVLGARYNDRSGLSALGIDVDGCAQSDLALRQSANPFPVSRQFARPPADWRHD
jgi:hypothetical protein